MRELLHALVLVAGFTAGCAGRAPEPSEGERAPAELGGGEAAEGSEYAAIGALVTSASAPFRSFCTATLVAPRVAVTAKHCTRDLEEGTRFALGADARAPERLVGIASFTAAALDRGGFMRLGSDVAVLHLAEPVEGIPPIPVGDAPVTAESLGETFEAVGYGVQGPGLPRDARRRGELRLYAVEGAPLPAYFGSLSRFLDAAEDHYEMPLGEFLVEDLTVRYGRKLLAEYEAYLVGASAQTCHGDSGGPLLRRTPAGREVVGVVSGGPLPATIFRPSVCAGGNILAILGPAARDVLEASLPQPEKIPE